MTRKVKHLDEIAAPPLIEHVGWRLWRVTQIWQDRFTRGMVEQGHAWFREARAAVVPHIDRAGTRQADLTARLGMTKQAVQQLVDALVQDGVVERRPDPNDARGRVVCFTPRGLRVLGDANRVKKQIEQELARAVGAESLSRLNAELLRVIEEYAQDRNDR
jgi:DNA-binding MarR family transcriptional regulator